MNFQIDKNSSIQINEQIKLQLRYQIINGDLPAGTKLLSVREMASFLGVNRHTISKAYKDLQDEGLIETRQSNGTYVAENVILPAKKDLENFIKVVKDAISKTKALGFSTEEFIDIAQAIYIKETNGSKNIKALFVECNEPALNQFVKDLQDELGIDVEGCLLSEIEEGKMTQGAIGEFDLVVTTVGHYPYLKQKIKDHENVYAINFGPYLQVINEIRPYPRDSSIGVVCIGEEGSLGLKQVLVDLEIAQGAIFSETVDSLDRVKEMANRAEVLVVSRFALEEYKDYFESVDKNIIVYENVLQRTSVEMLKEVVDQLKQGKS
ncbi:MAG: GntR family transcriptional regulator [Tissierellia bacterium]|nr:GntR family transcriptional regulator [Tissierellia bacterium]